MTHEATQDFNYTDTLETVYEIDASRILYIHGKVNDIKYLEVKLSNDLIHNTLMFGSIDNIDISNSIHEDAIRQYKNDDFYGISIEPAIEGIKEACIYASKDINNNLGKLSKFFNYE